MGTAEQRESAVEGPPDWGVVKGEVRCPLCEYELRGLAEPRCPECGYGFEWAEVLDPERQVHRYLFEHHPERTVWSFWRTAVGTWRPGRFWRELRPAQPSHGRRLVAYWVVAVAFVLAGVGGMFGLGVVDAAGRRAAERAAVVKYASQGVYPSFAAYAAVARTNYGSIQQYLDAELPPPSSVAFYRQQAGRFWRDTIRQMPLTAFALGAYVAWPWVTVAGLMVFQVSMRRARVRPVHVVRCALYSFDGGVWIGSGILATGLAIAWPMARGMAPGWWVALYWPLWVPWAVAVLLVVAENRLRVAYGRYLQMDLAWAVVLASQVMAALAAAAVLFSWDAAVRELLRMFR